ncbi:MAG TPA: metallophosphoesterase [Planctomycetota bacterium]|nr:metallophosphoesterase [Planctomycetota bacterium]
MARILFVGDIHLGRAPSHIPAGFDATLLGPRSAWRAVAAYSIKARIDAVVLAGDVVRSDNADIEACGHLQTEVRRMTQAGIPVHAVAGNHDVIELSRKNRVRGGGTRDRTGE